MGNLLAEAYRILYGEIPSGDPPLEALAKTIMMGWDGRKFDGNPVRERIGKAALATIAVLNFYPQHYREEMIERAIGRLRELAPELGDYDLGEGDLVRLADRWAAESVQCI